MSLIHDDPRAKLAREVAEKIAAGLQNGAIRGYVDIGHKTVISFSDGKFWEGSYSLPHSVAKTYDQVVEDLADAIYWRDRGIRFLPYV